MCETTNRNKNKIQKSTQVVKFSTFGQSQWKLNLLWSHITLRAEALKLPISALRVISELKRVLRTLTPRKEECCKL